MWDLPGSGIISKSPAWAGGFFTTEPPGKPQALYFGSPLLIMPFYLPKCEMVASFEISFAIFFLFDNLKKNLRDLPGSPVVKMPRLHCRGAGLFSGQGTKILLAA